LKRLFIASLLAALILTSILSFAGVTPVFAGAGETFTTEVTKRINPDMDEFVFRLESYEDEYWRYTKTITIVDAKNDNVIQTLVTNEFNDGEYASTNTYENPGLIFEDMNFDGYDDIRIVAFTPPGPNIPYICWLWDNDTRQFVHDADLSAVLSLEVDKENEWISSFARDGASRYRTEYHRWADGKLKLFKAIDVRYDDDDTEETVTWELKDGELVETGRTKEKLK